MQRHQLRRVDEDRFECRGLEHVAHPRGVLAHFDHDAARLSSRQEFLQRLTRRGDSELCDDRAVADLAHVNELITDVESDRVHLAERDTLAHASSPYVTGWKSSKHCRPYG